MTMHSYSFIVYLDYCSCIMANFSTRKKKGKMAIVCNFPLVVV